MKVFGFNVNTAPKNTQLCFRGGDCYNPSFGGAKWYCPIPILPFISINILGHGFYLGWKCYGVIGDSIVPDSLALEFTARLFNDG